MSHRLHTLAVGVLSAVLALELAFLPACSVHATPPHHLGPDGGRCDVVYRVTDQFSDEENQLLDDAVERWNAIAISKFCLTNGGIKGDAHTVSKMSAAEAASYGANVIGEYTGAYGLDQGDTVSIIEGLSADMFEETALHELGHAHGLGHTASPAIMSPVTDGTADFTPIDIAECQRVGACASAMLTDTDERNSVNCVFIR